MKTHLPWDGITQEQNLLKHRHGNLCNEELQEKAEFGRIPKLNGVRDPELEKPLVINLILSSRWPHKLPQPQRAQQKSTHQIEKIVSYIICAYAFTIKVRMFLETNNTAATWVFCTMAHFLFLFWMIHHHALKAEAFPCFIDHFKIIIVKAFQYIWRKVFLIQGRNVLWWLNIIWKKGA